MTPNTSFAWNRRAVMLAAQACLGLNAHAAEAILRDRLGLTPAGAAAVVAMHLGCSTRTVLGPAHDLAQSIHEELDPVRP